MLDTRTARRLSKIVRGRGSRGSRPRRLGRCGHCSLPASRCGAENGAAAQRANTRSSAGPSRCSQELLSCRRHRGMSNWTMVIRIPFARGALVSPVSRASRADGRSFASRARALSTLIATPIWQGTDRGRSQRAVAAAACSLDR